MGKSSKFLIGALLGAAAAALLTPVSGKRARGSALRAAKRAGVPTEKLEGALSDLVEKGGELLAQAAGSKTKRKK